jgi:DNA-binding response OmpR family regulator
MDAGTHEASKDPAEPPAYELLIIEDDHNTAEGLRLLFEFDGFSVSVAEDAVDGLRLARLRHPQAVVCDIDLNGVLNGFDVAAVLRSDPATSSAFLVAVTACGDINDRLRGARVGFRAYLDKPVNYRHLLAVVRAGAEDTTR